MLGIRKETDYAVRTVLHLAAIGRGKSVQVRDVAAQRHLPLSFVRRIVARLHAEGIVATTRGTGGGIRLARPASEISLLDVLEAMDDGVALNRCLEVQHTCPLADGCPAQGAWSEATAVLEGHLASVRFDALSLKDTRHGSAHRDLPGGPDRGESALPGRSEVACGGPDAVPPSPRVRRAADPPDARRKAPPGTR